MVMSPMGYTIPDEGHLVSIAEAWNKRLGTDRKGDQSNDKDIIILRIIITDFLMCKITTW